MVGRDSSGQIRCLWEGQLDKTVLAIFGVDQLDSQIVSFSGDTANSFMNIRIGKGPLAPLANGLVRIGEIMTMVISVTGDPGFDIHVNNCSTFFQKCFCSESRSAIGADPGTQAFYSSLLSVVKRKGRIKADHKCFQK
ncbi:hypothetical protein QYM36_019958 [Artemia franciscana]|uniref:Uncharacterized protein n=1 Tax=Artemia franciscana TaxID=6661 RepID=A0AA88H6H3_ARTSF|nr:hypothetical protein QYM36_019958 [Artemia franciscana]